MATKVGFDKAIFGILDDQEQLVKGDSGLSANGIFVADAATSKGVTTASVTGLDPTQNKIYGSNTVTRISQKGSGAVSATLGANDIPESIIYKLSGMEQDADSGAFLIGKNTVAPDAAVIFVSDELNNESIYFALLKGKFVPSDITLNTNNDQEQTEVDSLRFSAVNRASDGNVFASFIPETAPVDEEKVLKFVFPGYASSATSTTTTTK